MLPEFLGSCEVCGKIVRTYRALAGHLRHNVDIDHQVLKVGWLMWRAQRRIEMYRAQLECRKCGSLWEVRDKSLSNRKRCPACEVLRHTLGKRVYEAAPTVVQRLRCVVQQKAVSSVVWVPGDALYTEVVESFRRGEHIKDLMPKLGLTYKVLRRIANDAFGVEGYRALVLEMTRNSRVANVRLAHDWYNALGPEERAALMKRRFGGASSLELAFSAQLQAQGIVDIELNQWQTVAIGSELVPREADVKMSVGDGRKVVILCDGEAFHGPGVIHGSSAAKIESDRETALGFFSLGYSVVRYSEAEIHTGVALHHLTAVLHRLQSCKKLYRNWCPMEECVA